LHFDANMGLNRKKRKVKYESKRIIQAQHKNAAEGAQLNVVNKYLKHENRLKLDDLDHEVRSIKKGITGLLATRAIPGEALNLFHKEQKEHIRDVSIHIVNCYVCRQNKNKQKYVRQQMSKGADVLPYGERPVRTPEHMDFIIDAFPEVTNMVELGWKWGSPFSNVDIYQHGRAGHDMKCMSTRAKPVGNYTQRGPRNFRLWCPEDLAATDMAAADEFTDPVNSNPNRMAPSPIGAPAYVRTQRRTSVTNRRGSQLPPDDALFGSTVRRPSITTSRRGSMATTTLPPLGRRGSTADDTGITAYQAQKRRRDSNRINHLGLLVEDGFSSKLQAKQAEEEKKRVTGYLERLTEKGSGTEHQRKQKAMANLIEGMTDGRILTENLRQRRFENIMRSIRLSQEKSCSRAPKTAPVPFSASNAKRKNTLLSGYDALPPIKSQNKF